ncbi:MAG: hypothetical protein ABI808_11340 [Pseudonocardiales bacterium]
MGTSNACHAVVIGGLVTVLIAACTSSPPQPRPSTAPPTVASSPPPSSRPAGGPVELSCADSISASPGDGPGILSVNGLTLEGASGDLRGAAPASVGLRAPAGPRLYFVKSPAYLNATTAPITVELTASSKGYLAWVPARIWTGSGGSPIDLRPWVTSRLTFDGCPDRDTSYLGGLLASNPHVCLTVHVRRAGAATSEATRLGGAGC